MSSPRRLTPTERLSSASQDARREMYHQLILAAAESEFARNGYAATRVNAIAAHADLSLATVYNNFGGKADIWHQLHQQRLDQLFEAVAAAHPTSDSVLDGIVASLATTARFLCEQSTFLDLSLTTGSDWAGDTASAHGAQRTIWSEGVEMITNAIAAGIRRGEVRDLPPRVAAKLVISGLHVWLNERAVSGHTQPIDQIVEEISTYARLVLSPRT